MPVVQRAVSSAQQRPSARRAPPVEDRANAPAEALLSRVVVVQGPRAADLAAELGVLGIGARTVHAEALATMIAGLVVCEDGEELLAAAEALAGARRRQAAVACVALSDRTPSELADLLLGAADVVLPSAAPASAVAAQLRALARLLATEPPSAEPEIVTVRNISIDLERHEVRAGGRLLNLTPTEFRILSLLARKRGVVSHGELFRELHGYDVSDQEAKDILKVHIWRLRAKLAEAVPDSNPIVNVRGFGYLLEKRSTRRATHAGETDG